MIIIFDCVKNMSIVLEPVVDQAEVETVATPPETAAPESVVEAAPEPVVEAAPEPVEQAAEPTTPAKKRGRPRKDVTPAKVAPKARAKAAPKKAATAPVPAAPPPSSSDEEPMSHADLETEILNYLVQRKSQQQDRRRQLWSQLAGLS